MSGEELRGAAERFWARAQREGLVPVTQPWQFLSEREQRGVIAALSDAVPRILAARVASAAAERDQAVAVADSMQHFADVAEVCERKSNEYAAENAALKARLDGVRELAEEMCAFDIVDMPVPDSVDVPEDYELGVNDYGGRLGAVLAAAHDEGSEQR